MSQPVPTQSQSTQSPLLSRGEQELLYRRVTKYLLWGLGIAGTLITAIAGVSIYFSYSNVRDIREEYSNSLKDMRDDYSNTIKDLKSEIKDLRGEAYSTTKDIRQEAKEALTETQAYSTRELSRIEQSTNQLALDETRRQLGDIFGSNKIQDLIETQAVGEVKAKVEDIIKDMTKNLTRINDAASEMRIGRVSGMYKLRSYFTSSTSKLDSLTAKNLYDQICQDYYDIYIRDTATIHISGIDSLPSIINENEKLPLKVRLTLERLVSVITDKEQDLNVIAYCILYLSHHTGNQFKLFEIEEINRWFNRLKK